MSEEAAGHHGWLPLTGLQLWQEIMAVKVKKLLQVSKDDPSFPPEVLGYVQPVHQGEVVSQNVTQRAYVLPLCEHQLLHHTLQPPGNEKNMHKLVTKTIIYFKHS